MRKRIFVDTAAWLALVNKSDEAHQRAKEIRDDLLRLKAQLVLTDYVVLEVANALCKIPFRPAAIKLIDSIRATKSIQVVEIDKGIYKEAWTLYSERPDKEWSLTDCASFVVMRQTGITEAFTTDGHFEQAGFAILIKDQ
jgi:predicted nucleic acid-binding protein